MAKKKRADDKPAKEEWGFSTGLPWHPSGDRCVWCGRKDEATISRKYPQGNYQICQVCYDYQKKEEGLEEKYFSGKPAASSLEDIPKEYWEELKKLEKECSYDFFHCPFCGKKMLKYGIARAGLGGFVLHSCRSAEHMDCYMADRRGGYKREATKEEKQAKQRAIDEAKRKNVFR